MKAISTGSGNKHEKANITTWVWQNTKDSTVVFPHGEKQHKACSNHDGVWNVIRSKR